MRRTVIRAEVLGFCMGVRRAINMVEKAVEGSEGQSIQTFGPLIHNRQAIEDLKAQGVGQIDTPEEFEKGAVVIRAHGVSKSTKDELNRCGASIIDGTCPRVRRSMKLAQQYSSLGYKVVIVGDPGHGEVQAIEGYAENTSIVSSPEEARRLELGEPTLVIAQTTISVQEYQAVLDVLNQKGVVLEIIDSICPATRDRQDALRELAKEVEAIVVIGGLNSSNTKRLQQLALSFGKPAWHVEHTGQLPAEIRNYTRIGITAGASTPDRMIDEVDKYIRDLD